MGQSRTFPPEVIFKENYFTKKGMATTKSKTMTMNKAKKSKKLPPVVSKKSKTIAKKSNMTKSKQLKNSSAKIPTAKTSAAKKVPAAKSSAVKIPAAKAPAAKTSAVKIPAAKNTAVKIPASHQDAAAPPEKFDLNSFITIKLGKVETKNRKQILSDRTRSSLVDLVKFKTTLAFNHYKIKEEDSLEVCLLSLQSEEDIKKLVDKKPNVTKACREVATYRDLLMLGDLPTITQERRIYEWIHNAPILSIPSQVTLMVSFITLAIKLTGTKDKMFGAMPGGKLSGMKREEVVSYLAIIQTIAESMAKTNKWEKLEKFAILNKMNNDLGKIINDF